MTKRRLHINRLIAFLLCSFFVLSIDISCKKSNQQAPPSKTKSKNKKAIYTVNYPLKYFAERIAGNQLEIIFPAPPDGDPAFWMPNDKSVMAYQQADLVLLNGAKYAHWVDKVSLPESKLVNTSAAFKDRYLILKEAMEHSHGPEGEHAHEGIDFTTWLDPQLAKLHAQAILESFIKLSPQHSVIFKQNFDLLKKDLQNLDVSFQKLFSNYHQEPLIASHPVYNYFARRYKLNLKSLHWEPDEMLDDTQWQQFEQLLKTHPAKWVIWEAPPSEKVIEKLKHYGVGCAVFNQNNNVSSEGDYLQVMQNNLERLKPVF